METALHLGYRLPPSANPDLDYLLGQVAEAVQLTPTQYTKANTSYTAVGEWLGARESPLAALGPKIYPQGSMRLGTTVRPRGRVEHDLDLVLQVNGTWTAMGLYDAVYARLWDNGTYRPMLKKKNRCLCLEYAGDFHLDIIPAVPDALRGGTSILIPDRKLEHWTRSDPKGYAAWFEHRSVGLLMEQLARAQAEPLPPHSDADQKQPLAVAVQLIKRARDVMFNGADVAPRSIILTTLAGHHYSGGTCVATIIVEVMQGISAQIRAAAPRRIEISNPTNAAEKFSDGFTDERYQALSDFASFLGSRAAELLQLRGVERLQAALEKLFDDAGQKPATAAVRKYQELERSRRNAGTLTYSAAGLEIVAPPTGNRVPRNNYFGG